MDKRFTYLSDLTGAELNVETNLQWVHSMPVGEAKHPVYGKLDFSLGELQKYAYSVKSKLRGIDPDVDYDHKLDPSKGRVAAGWIKDADVREDGLWLLVEWTEKAKDAIKNREYRYFSPEFTREWINEKGEKLKNVVLGGGLTNRPFLKNLVPVNLHEIEGYEQENVMDPKKLAQLLGLSEDASEEDIETKLTELANATKDDPSVDLSKVSVKVNDEGKLIVTHPDSESEWQGELPKLETEQNDDHKELAKLAESNPAIAKILSEHQTMQEDMKTLKTTQRLSEVTTQLSEIGSEHKKALPPAVSNKFRDLMVQLPKKLSDELAEGLKEFIKVGAVELGENTPSTQDGKREDNSGDVTTYLNEVTKIATEQKVTTAQASAIVNESQPELYSRYLSAVEEGQALVEQEA